MYATGPMNFSAKLSNSN